MEYKPLWYETTAKEEFKTPKSVVKQGQQVFFTPSVTDGVTIVFDRKKAIRTMTEAEAARYLASTELVNPVGYSSLVDHQYMEATLKGYGR